MTVQIRVPITNDDLFEQDEMFQGLISIVSGERVSVDIDVANATIIASKNTHCVPTLHINLLFLLYS